jgi:hypothetical protein
LRKGKLQGKIVNTWCIKFFENKSIRQNGKRVDVDETFTVITNNAKAYIPSAGLHLSMKL